MRSLNVNYNLFQNRYGLFDASENLIIIQRDLKFLLKYKLIHELYRLSNPDIRFLAVVFLTSEQFWSGVWRASTVRLQRVSFAAHVAKAEVCRQHS